MFRRVLSCRPETTPRTRPEALTLRDQFDLFETRASDFEGSYRSLVPQKRPRKMPDIRIARQESPKYTCCKSNRPFIGDLEQSERYAVPPSDRSSAIAMRLGVPDERRERLGERERDVNINLPITGIREPPIPSSTTHTRFPVSGYCAIVVRVFDPAFPRIWVQPSDSIDRRPWN